MVMMMMMMMMMVTMMMMMMMTVARLRICTASSYDSSGVPTIKWPIENKLSQCVCSATTPFSLVVLRLHSSLCFKILILASSGGCILVKVFPQADCRLETRSHRLPRVRTMYATTRLPSVKLDIIVNHSLATTTPHVHRCLLDRLHSASLIRARQQIYSS
jgi:hypothetical protein